MTDQLFGQDDTDGAYIVQPASLGAQALRFIRQAIVAGELSPNRIYSASTLAERLGVSNSPVREAMLRLVDEGFLLPVRNRGYRVVAMSRGDLEEVHELRKMLEVPSMGHLAEQADRLDLAPFDALLDSVLAAAAQGDVTSYLAADRDFHLRLTELLGNMRLSEFVGRLRDQTRLYGMSVLSQTGRLMETAREHTEILDAIRCGDRPRTEELMRLHLSHIRNEWAESSADR